MLAKSYIWVRVVAMLVCTYGKWPSQTVMYFDVGLLYINKTAYKRKITHTRARVHTHTHFIVEEETKAQRGEVIGPRSHKVQKLESRSIDSLSSAPSIRLYCQGN